MNHYNNRHKGFSLIELMLVVSILSLIIGMTVNGIIGLIQWNQLNQAAEAISCELKNAQSRAFYEGKYYKIQFWPTLNRYRVYQQAELVEDRMLEPIELYDTNFTDDHVYFYPNGVPGQGGTITLKNHRGKTRYVIMTPVTARVRISSEPPENW